MAGSVLAWQGFRFEHPEDWAVTAVSGDRRSGYLRLSSSGAVGCQVRWQASRGAPDLGRRLEAYFDLLRKDAKRAKVDFRREVEPGGGKIVYRWIGAGQGRGAIQYCEDSRRVVFLEVVGRRKDSLLPDLRRSIDSFGPASSEGLEEWSVFGLRIRVPNGMRVERRRFLSGRTELYLARLGLRIEAQRWALAEQLVARHGLEAWSRAVLRLPKTPCTSSELGLCFEGGSKLRALGSLRALVSHDEKRNQITLLRARWHTARLEPKWDWLRHFDD